MPRRFFVGLIVGLVLVISISHVGAALVVARAFRPGLALSGGLLLTVGLFLVGRRLLGSANPGAVPGSHSALGFHPALGRDVLLLMAVALVFRFAPIPEFAGGRDDGVYTNMAAFLMRAPSPEHHDLTLVEQPNDGRAFLSDAAPQATTRLHRWVPDNRVDRLEGNYLPGVYVADADDLAYTFQFIHVLPIWMSIAGALLGMEQMGYAVILFSLLSILLFYLLVLALTRQRSWSLAGGMLLAVNPLHAHFARNSVTEPVALCCNVMMLLAFAWAWRLDDHRRWRRALVAVGVGAFSMFCLTRMNGFFALPFLLVASVYVGSLARNRGERALITGALAGCVAVFGLSVWYLVVTSYPYALNQYHKIFQPVFGDGWGSFMPWLAGGYVVAAGGLMTMVHGGGRACRWFGRIRGWLAPAAMGLMLAALAYHGLKCYRLAVGDVADHVGYISRFGLAGLGLESVKHSSLVNAAFYLSPPLAGLLVWELLRWRVRDHVRDLIVFLLTGYFVYAAVLQWVLPFQFYYGRYLLPAVVPFMILLVVGSAARAPGRWRGALVGVGMLWCVVLSATQWQYRGQESFLRDLEAAMAPAARDDLVLLDRRGIDHNRLTLPLVYALDRNVWTFADEDHLQRQLVWANETRGNGTVWVMSRALSAPYLESVRSATIRWSHPRRASLQPFGSQNCTAAWTVHRVDWQRLPSAQVLFAGRKASSGIAIDGLHDDGVWTHESFETMFPAPVTERRQLVVSIKGWRPKSARLEPGQVEAVLNGEVLALERCVRDVLIWTVPQGSLRTENNRLAITVSPFVPADLRSDSPDRRRLGLDLDTMELR